MKENLPLALACKSSLSASRSVLSFIRAFSFETARGLPLKLCAEFYTEIGVKVCAKLP